MLDQHPLEIKQSKDKHDFIEQRALKIEVFQKGQQ